VGQGTVFTLRLPALPREVGAVSAVSEAMT
jgi:hypothetical protein